MATLNSNARTTTDELTEYTGTSQGTAVQNLMINIAYQMVQAHLSGSGLSSGILDVIELNLAAHYLHISRDRQAKSEDVAGEYSVTWLGKDDLGLEATLYGQQALALDTTGSLARARLKGVTFEVYETPDHGTAATGA